MTEEKKNKTRTSKEPKSLEPRVQITYNDLRKGIAEEVNSKFNTPVIEAFSKNEEDTITSLMDEFKEDTTVPTDLDLLYNYNASINTTISKWVKRYVRYSSGLAKNEKKLIVLDAIITEEYKRNPDAHNGILLTDKEIRNIILINQDHIELEEKINSIKAVIYVIEMAISRLKDMTYIIKNANETLKIKHYLINGNF